MANDFGYPPICGLTAGPKIEMIFQMANYPGSLWPFTPQQEPFSNCLTTEWVE